LLRLGALTATLALLSVVWPAVGVSARSAGAGSSLATTNMVTLDWLDDVIDVVDDLIDTLEEADDALGDDASALLAVDKKRIDGALNRATLLIDRILDPGQYPSLTPVDAGQIDAAVDPATLAEHAADCLELAYDARAQLDEPIVNQDLVGSNLKTIEHLITRPLPHSYRSLAGLGI
jgi:hypothetical protein